MINKIQIQKEILRKILSKLNNFGFDKKIHGQSFWKPIENGRVMIHLSFINHEDDFDITTSVSIRFDDLEEMINEDNNLLTTKEKQHTSTIGIELGNLSEGRQKRWNISEKSDLSGVVEDIWNEIEDVAFPYLEKYENMENVFEMMLKDDVESWTFAPLHHKRAMNAVGLAKLLNKDNIKEISEKKSEFLLNRNDYGLNMFIKFTKKLL